MSRYGFEQDEVVAILGMAAQENGFPFNVSDADLDRAVVAIKRQRGDVKEQAKRVIRTELANKLGWKFAMDGGFMQGSSKEWQEGGTMFAKLYQEYEALVFRIRELEG